MEARKNMIEPMLNKIESCSKISLKIVQLKTVEKTALISSSLISKLFLIVTIFSSLVFLNIALALWLGEILGKNYFGFLLIGLIYVVFGIILFLFQPMLKKRIVNSVINQLLN